MMIVLDVVLKEDYGDRLEEVVLLKKILHNGCSNNNATKKHSRYATVNPTE